MIALEISTFLGRFHPVLVHLPIGFLLLAILMEWWQKRKETAPLAVFINYSWFLGALSAVLAAICGWLLASSGDYAEAELFWHRWLGVGLALVASLGWWVKRRPQKYSPLIQRLLAVAVLVILVIEGHLGGNLTHGEDYLVEYAPKPLRNLFGDEETSEELPRLAGKDSIRVYTDMVYPILEAKCIACHNTKEARGGLNMAEEVDFQNGGDNGPVLAASIPAESELFRRVTLPPKSEKYMPPSGDPLSYDEIQVLEWWIAQGADFENLLDKEMVPEEMREVLLKLYGLDTAPKPWYESVTLEAADSVLLREITESGFKVKSLGGENPLLDLRFSGDQLTEEHLIKLAPLKEHITWFSLAETNVKDDWLVHLAGFENLTRLQLEKTSITDKGISYLRNMEHLESLNLYKTGISDEALEVLAGLPALKRVYLWETKVSREAMKQLEERNEVLEVVAGIEGN